MRHLDPDDLPDRDPTPPDDLYDDLDQESEPGDGMPEEDERDPYECNTCGGSGGGDPPFRCPRCHGTGSMPRPTKRDEYDDN